MATRKIKFKMTATIVQYHVVEVDEKNIPKCMDILDYAEQEAQDNWDYTQPSDDERFTQDIEYIDEL